MAPKRNFRTMADCETYFKDQLYYAGKCIELLKENEAQAKAQLAESRVLIEGYRKTAEENAAIADQALTTMQSLQQRLTAIQRRLQDRKIDLSDIYDKIVSAVEKEHTQKESLPPEYAANACTFCTAEICRWPAHGKLHNRRAQLCYWWDAANNRMTSEGQMSANPDGSINYSQSNPSE